MKRWVCPHCGKVVESIGSEVGHPCPKNRNRWTLLKEGECPDQ